MFSSQDLTARLSELSGTDSPLLEVVEFGHQDFDSPSSEQSIEAFRGLKRDFAEGLLFWVKTLQAQDWQGREASYVSYAESALCQPIDKLEFQRVVTEYSGSLRVPLPELLVNLPDFQSGLRMYAEWNDVAVFAELGDSFVAFYWCTTA